MNDEQFREWLQIRGRSAGAEEVIQRIRRSGPSRRVQGGFSNVTGRFPSRKMGFTIQFESHQVELPFIREYEYSDEVHEYYDQPGQVKLSYSTTTGRPVSALSTPDFFVLRADGTAGWEECKPEGQLCQLAKKSNRFRKVGDSWACPPGAEYAERLGLYFRVRSSDEINWTYQRNLDFLDDYLRDPNPPPIDMHVASLVTAIVSCRQGLTLSDLFLNAVDVSRDEIFALLVSGDIYIDIRSHLLVEPDRVPVFTDAFNSTVRAPISLHSGFKRSETAITFSTGEKLVWDENPFEVVNAAGGRIWLKNAEGKILDLSAQDIYTLVLQGHIQAVPGAKTADSLANLAGKDPTALAAANKRYATILPFLRNDADAKPERSAYRWIKAYRDAEAQYGNGYYGLLPNTSERGNRSAKLPQESFEFISKCLEEAYLTTEQPTVVAAYALYRNRCESANVIAASRKTFAKELRKMQKAEVERKRRGNRAAYKYETFFWRLSSTTPRHGDRPFEIAHIDHTELDIQLVDKTTRKPLGRPWLTLMIDAWSRKILAFALTFENPSYRSCLLVLRDCVQRHSRLPQTIVVDHGKEFSSTYFESFIALYDIIKKERPPAKARFGAVMERIFGTTNTQFLYNLKGNTQIMRNVREVTKSVNPATHAVWTFETLANALQRFFFEEYETISHPALGESPRDAFARGQFDFGLRPFRLIPCTEYFIFSTLPTTSKGSAKVILSRGIKIRHIFYWCPEFGLAGIPGTQVPVRYDPFDIGIAYAFVGNAWVKCVSEFHAQLSGLNEIELQAISNEIFKRNAMHSKNYDINAQKIAAFVEEMKGQEKLLLAQQLAAETKAVQPPANSLPEELPARRVTINDIDGTETYEDLA